MMNDTFIRACRGESVEYTPVWLMRQAGRYLPEYRSVRSQVDFLTLCKNPKLAAEVTIQPVDILGVDAAILFSDILIPLEAMGVRVEFSEKEGPILSEPVRTRSTVEKLVVPDVEEDLPFVFDTIRILRKELANKVPLIGFGGAPFTLATYLIEGGTSKQFLHTKKMMFQNGPVFHYLMEKITDMLTSYLVTQVRAGAQAIQIFDSWAGICAPIDYKKFAFPYAKRVVAEIKKEGVPVIYFVNDCAGLLKEVKAIGADVISIDWRIDMTDAIKKLGKKTIVQGNLDPCALFLPGEKLEERVKEILWKGELARSHIFNLGHGVLPQTPVESVIALVDAVHRYGRKT